MNSDERPYGRRRGDNKVRARRSRRKLFVGLMLCGLIGPTALADNVDQTQPSPETKADGRMFAAYYESWLGSSEDSGLDEVLARLPRVVTVVNLSFMRPDAHYAGGLELSGTGLEFDYPGAILRNSIQKLKERNPQTKVLVSVGGEEATNWAHLAPDAIARFVRDFGLDGVDIDFEPKSPGCKRVDDTIKCNSEQLLSRAIRSLRAALPHPFILSLAAFNTSAYGEDRWKEAEPTGSDTYGMLLGFFRDRAVHDIDFINLMAYDAGASFDPVEAYDAFRNYFHKPILIGFTPPPESWGDHAYSPEEIRRVLHTTLERGAAGAMLFSLRKLPPGSPDTGRLTPLVQVISGALTTH